MPFITQFPSRIDVYLHSGDNSIDKKLDSILKMLGIISRKEDTIMANLDALTAQVTKNTEVEASAIVLLQGLATQIAELKTDPAALQALADNLNSSATALADAIVANTPSS